MAKPKHTMVPRRPSVLLALLASASNQTLLAAFTVGSLNAGLVSSASAATCVTSVSPTFANVISGVTGAPGQNVVTSVTPTFASVTTTANPFLTSAGITTGTAVTSATLNQATGTAVTSATLNQATGSVVTSATTGTVTGIDPGSIPSNQANLRTVAVDVSITNNNNPPALFAFSGGGATTTNNGGTILWTNPTNPGLVGPLLTVPFLSGTTTNTPVVTGVTSTPGTFLTNVTSVAAPQQNNFLTSGTSVAAPQQNNFLTSATATPPSANAVTGVGLTAGTALSPNAVVSNLNVTTAPLLTGVTPTTTPVVNSVAVGNSGTSASASSLGCGVNDQANGANATAIGTNANANGTGATALGGNAVASADGAIAIGASQSTGVNSIAIGTGAVATGSVAVGAAASAANGGAAFGDGATATGLNATAIGPGASATFANSTAIGNGAVATRDNQVVLGTASNTYTAPGITSAASRAAQSGPLQIVTSDAGGNLATNTAAGLGLASLTDINAINSQLGGMNARINDLDGRTTKALNGVSMAFAIAGTPWLLPTERFAMTMDWGTFQGTNAVALNGAMRLGTNVQANGGIAYGANGGGVGGRAGVRVGW